MTRLLLPWLLAGVFLASLGLNVKSWVRTAGNPDPAPPEHLRARCIDLEELELTPSQEAALTSCCQALGGEESEGLLELNRKQEELEAALVQDTLDEAKVRQLATEIGELRNRLLKGRVESVIKIRTILKPCQMLRIRGGCDQCSMDDSKQSME